VVIEKGGKSCSLGRDRLGMTRGLGASNLLLRLQGGGKTLARSERKR